MDGTKIPKTNRYCVFCGGTPSAKTREHVIPKWLIELTGDPDRQINFPLFRLKGETPPGLTFQGLAFPACSKCNAHYSHLESQAKNALKTIISGGVISESAVDAFLDWLDKVRIGLWLGLQLIEKNPFEILPRFHIATRLGMRDRFAAFYRIGDQLRGLNLLGMNTPAFHFYPSCFGLVINNLAILNGSDIFLFSKRVGFPYPNGRLPAGELSKLDLLPGTSRLQTPLLRIPYLRSDLEVFQPMFADGSLQGSRQLYENEFVRSLALDFDAGRGKPLVQNGRTVSEYSEDVFVEWQSRTPWKRINLLKKLTACTYKLQVGMFEHLYYSPTATVQKFMHEIHGVNRYLVKKAGEFYSTNSK